LLGIKKADRGWRIRILPELLKGEGENTENGLLGFTIGEKILPGETEYRIGLIPFGGFVKMLGQEDVGPVKTSDDPRSYANKPALARAAVLAAGVTFNVISAVIVYIVVFLVGINLPGPVVGGVMSGSPADKAGIRAGDEIVEVAGNSSRLDFSDVMMAAVLSGKNEVVPMKIRHEDGTTDEVNIAAKQETGGRYREFGIERALTLTVAKVAPEDANFLKETTGLMPGDKIKAAASIDVNSHWEYKRIVDGAFEPNVALLAERRDTSGKTSIVEGQLPLSFMPSKNLNGESEANLANICGMVPRLKITAVTEGPRSFKEWFLRLIGVGKSREKLKQGDIIVGVADVNDPTFSEMREITKVYENNDLAMTVLRTNANGIEKQMTISMIPRRDADSNRVVIGIVPELDTEHTIVAKTISTELYPNPPAIPRGATITAVDGVAVSNFYDIARQLKKNAGQRVTIDWRINKQNAGNTAIETGLRGQIVTAPAMPKQIVPFKQLVRLYKADGPVEAMRMGYKRTKIFIIQSYVTLHRLVGGLLSPKELMGPVGILAFSYKIVSDQPFVYYVYFLGLISASLAVLNFLPMPPLDGGLTLLLLIEKIKGSAISVRTQEIIAYLGWGMVGTLLLYVTFNDIGRLIFGFFS
jgi:regulator of sigma E protease